MTINVGEFTDWQAKGAAAHDLFPTCSPNLVLIGAWEDAEYGTTNLGCKGVRDNRAGTADSTHSFGAAGDRSFRYSAPSASARRAKMLECIERLRQGSAELGIQAIHDYIGCRIWRSNRDPHVYPDGWKIQPVSNDGMGQPWADWIHVEVHERGWHMNTPVNDRLAGVSPPVLVRPVVGPGSANTGLVRAVQTFLIEKANQGAVVGAADGRWGPRTSAGWTNFYVWENTLHPGCMTTDGNVDGVDWNVIAWVDGGWRRLYDAGFPRGV